MSALELIGGFFLFCALIVAIPAFLYMCVMTIFWKDD